MTKPRGAASHHGALRAVLELIGVAEAARVCGRGHRTIHNWTEPQGKARGSLSVADALRLDRAYLAAGGAAPPIGAWYQAELELFAAEAFDAARCRAQAAASAAKEAGEAIAAQLLALRPGADMADVRIARREVEEAIAAFAMSLAALRLGDMVLAL